MSKLGQCGWNDSYVTGTKTVGANDNGNEETRAETALCNSGCMPVRIPESLLSSVAKTV